MAETRDRNRNEFEALRNLPDKLIKGDIRFGKSKQPSLAQTCLRVADLTFTRRASLIMPFAEDVEEIFADAELTYEPSVDLVGRFGSPVSVDYLVTGKQTKSAVLALTSATAPGAHAATNEIFRKWYDLAGTAGWDRQAVTIFDDRRQSIFRDDDLERLADESLVLDGADRKTSARSFRWAAAAPGSRRLPPLRLHHARAFTHAARSRPAQRYCPGYTCGRQLGCAAATNKGTGETGTRARCGLRPSRGVSRD